MRMRHILACGVAIVGLAGCTSPQIGAPVESSPRPETSTPTKKPTKSSDPVSDLPSHGAPKVKSPVETAKFQPDPCAIFTEDQLREYGVGAGKLDTDPLGKICTWETADSGSFDLGWDVTTGRGLSGVYHQKQTGQFTFFEPLPDIEGLPAVAVGVVDTRSAGVCSISVGVSDTVSFLVSLEQSASKQGTRSPCDVAVTIAADAVKNMKAGA